MKTSVKTLKELTNKSLIKAAIYMGGRYKSFVDKYGHASMAILGVTLITFGSVEAAHAQQFADIEVRQATCLILKFLEGAFGALLMVVAGLVAIIAAAMGAYRLAMSMLVVAIGAFILRAFVDVFFDVNIGDTANDCTILS